MVGWDERKGTRLKQTPERAPTRCLHNIRHQYAINTQTHASERHHARMLRDHPSPDNFTIRPPMTGGACAAVETRQPQSVHMVHLNTVIHQAQRHHCIAYGFTRVLEHTLHMQPQCRLTIFGRDPNKAIQENESARCKRTKKHPPLTCAPPCWVAATMRPSCATPDSSQ